MTADTEKSPTSKSTVCFICNASINVSTRNSCQIFHQTVNASNRPLSEIIGNVLGVELQEELIHSSIVCKKCFKSCNEVDELQERLTELKIEINGNYHRTIKKFDIDEVDDKQTVPEEETNAAPPSEEDKTAAPTPSTASPVQATKKIIVAKKQLSQTIKEAMSPAPQPLTPLQPLQPLLPPPPLTLIPRADPIDDEENGSGNRQSDSDDDNLGIDCGDDDDEDYEGSDSNQGGKDSTKMIKIEPIDSDFSDKSGNKGKKSKRKTRDELPAMIPQMVVSREGQVYTCLLCSADDKVTGDAKAIIAHMRDTHALRLYVCDICGQEYLKRNDLMAHLNEHVNSEEGDFQCEICNRIFSNLRLFRVHRRMHLPQSKNWTCDQCGKRYLSRNMLEEHMNSHTGARPYQCSVCGKDFASKYTFRSHEKTHTERPRPFACSQPHCTKSFLTQQNLLQHERTHSGVKNYSCEECGKCFGTARNLEVHCLVHTGFKPFICRLCGKAFARKAEIRDHERTHTGEKPYQCEFCGATFSQRSNLQSHKRATHYDDKRYKCMDCGKGFKRRRLLDYHVKAAHTGERPYKCTTCSATFIYPEHFKKHRRIHTGEKPYQCEVCGKAFNSRDNRNAHRFVHSDKKPYECLVCGMGFMRKPLLYAHMQTQGHLNDTIVVNQPRLTTDDDMITVQDTPMQEMTLVTDSEGNTKLIPADQVELDAGTGDTKMYIAELKEHVIIQRKDTMDKSVVGEEITEGTEYEEAVEHLIIDGQVHFSNPSGMESLEAGGGTGVVAGAEIATTLDDQHTTLVVPAGRHHAGEFGEHQTTMVQTEDGPVHLVHIRLPAGESADNAQWYNIVQQ
ncbi:zinc finger protein 3 homolog isoform X2 [Nilaparvata lugens]|uniref:zinc finger protein 3 homolog isoform X2 n=1 Tax=Nilaparvata lugens TaxID=108931 RepID=UPI000B99D55D|nr:zinc finger protein 3 homolog isoform X2 [Nilaparvata lugens]